MRRRAVSLRLPLLVMALAATWAAAATAGAQHEVVYAPAPAANAIYDAGISGALRQAPIVDVTDPRWPTERRLGKVSGKDLAGRNAAGMAALLRAQWHSHPVGGTVGGRVAVDEIVPTQWSTAASRELARAMAMLGEDARRVIFYLSPALVEQVGRVDMRQQLPTAPNDLRTLVDAMQPGVVYLELYRGSLDPYPLNLMAAHLTRWEARWPEARRPDLRLLFGPGKGLGQQEIWNRVRSTPAGRRLVSNSPGYYSTAQYGTAADGAAWAAALQRHRAAPDAPPPGGDFAVPEGGGLVIPQPTRALLPGGSLLLQTNRPGRAVVRLIAPNGSVRIIRGSLVVGPSGQAQIVLPKDVRPGAYRVDVRFIGEGLTDHVRMAVTIGRSLPEAGGGAGAQLRQSQATSVDAVRLLNAIDAWLAAGIAPGDLNPGGFGAAFLASGAPGALAPGLAYANTGQVNGPGTLAPRPIVAAPSKASRGRISVTPAQLLINQRISSAAVARANAIEARLKAGLTGGDLRPGALTRTAFADGVGVVVNGDDPVPPSSKVEPKPIRRGNAKGLRVTPGQIAINARIARAARLRAERLAARLTAGLGEGDFRAGSIVRANLAPEVGGPPAP